MVVLLIGLFFMSFVFADQHEVAGQADAEKVQKLIDENNIVNEDGEFENPLDKTKAEERIDKINLAIEDNASWLDAVFGMVPEVSWLFAIVLYVWLFFLVHLVLNTYFFDYFLDSTKARIFGGIIFLLMLITKVLHTIGKVFHDFLEVIYLYGPLGVVAVIVILVLIAWFFPQTVVFVRNYLVMKKEMMAKKKEEENREILDATVKGMTGE